MLTEAAATEARHDVNESINDKKSDLYSKKVELDKYYTKESVAINCLKLLNLDNYDFVVEPSAGNGSFYRNIHHNNKVGLDIKRSCKSFCVNGISVL